MKLLLANPFTSLMGFSLANGAFLCVFVAAGISPTAGAEALLRYGWGLMLVLWLDADAHRRHRIPCFDFGFLAAVFFPVSLVWYCVWSRGWGGGALLLLAMFGLWVFPYVIAGLFWALVQ